MKVTVRWRNINPFCPRIEDLGRVSDAEVPEDTTFEQIEEFAISATPKGYWLYKIEMPKYDMEYKYRDSSIKKKIEK
jgi:hypothetical protein